MPRLVPSLFAATLAVSLTLGGLHYAQNQRAHKLETLRRENNQLRQSILKRQQTPAPQASAQTQEPTTFSGLLEHVKSRSPSPGAGNAQATQAAEPEVFRNAGTATPAATLQTLAWACDRGDLQATAKLIVFEGESRSKLAALWTSLPPALRAESSSIEEFAAFLLCADALYNRYPGPDILEQAIAEPLPDGKVRLRMPETHREQTIYQSTSDGWKQVFTEDSVDYFAQRIANLGK